MPTGVRRPVITGYGLVTPLGNDPQPLLQALLAGCSGVRRITSFDPSGLPVQFGGEVPDFDARNFIDKKERKRLAIMPRPLQLGMAAAQLAVQNAGLVRGKIDPERFGVVFGGGTIPGEQVDLIAAGKISDTGPDGVNLKKWGAQGIPLVPPMWMLNFVPNMLACHVSILHDARGPLNTVTQTEVGGLLALDEASRMIRRNRADVVLVGAGDSRINAVSGVRQCLYSPLSRGNDDPEGACRPFDLHRDGSVLGEGGGVVVVEDLAHAQGRGAPIIADIVGHGAALDVDGSGTGLARAIRLALEGAEMCPTDLDHVNAHGIGTHDGDAWEARGIHQVLGDERVPVFGVKGAIGNLGSACGLVELIVSLAALKQGTIPATRNFREPDPACPVFVAREPRPASRRAVLKVNMTELGQCAAVACRLWS